MKKPKKLPSYKQQQSKQLEKVATKMLKKFDGLKKYKDIKL
jgi:hypothetical protein